MTPELTQTLRLQKTFLWTRLRHCRGRRSATEKRLVQECNSSFACSSGCVHKTAMSVNGQYLLLRQVPKCKLLKVFHFIYSNNSISSFARGWLDLRLFQLPFNARHASFIADIDARFREWDDWNGEQQSSQDVCVTHKLRYSELHYRFTDCFRSVTTTSEDCLSLPDRNVSAASLIAIEVSASNGFAVVTIELQTETN